MDVVGNGREEWWNCAKKVDRGFVFGWNIDMFRFVGLV